MTYDFCDPNPYIPLFPIFCERVVKRYEYFIRPQFKKVIFKMYCIFSDVWCTGVHLYCTVYCTVLLFFAYVWCTGVYLYCTVLLFCRCVVYWCLPVLYCTTFCSDVWCTGVHLYCTVLLFLQMCGVRVSTCVRDQPSRTTNTKHTR